MKKFLYFSLFALLVVGTFASGYLAFPKGPDDMLMGTRGTSIGGRKEQYEPSVDNNIYQIKRSALNQHPDAKTSGDMFLSLTTKINQEKAYRDSFFEQYGLDRIDLVSALNLFSDPEQVHELLIDKFGREEGNFRRNMIAHAADPEFDWIKYKNLILERESVTGEDYGRELLYVGLQKGLISSDEIIELAERGIQITTSHLSQLIQTGNIDTIAELVKSGIDIDINSATDNAVRRGNLITEFVNSVSMSNYFPNSKFRNRAPSGIANDLRKLFSLGVNNSSDVEGYDNLDHALIGADKFGDLEKQMAVIEVLVEYGASFDPSHKELIEKFRDQEKARLIKQRFGL